ncbi:hypothetical protein H7F50_08055 [Novosphingobium flavum]|uniref:DUF4071 domain-containing protein n=1 Tax=Novosphingobium aerophilum TaxID=2839843 RepID=A0A7X1F7M9_9SPHN|nr:tetratricopeptide repeat-containing protein [Novosphingobium aerophilum]MBC2651893.1 hypothetical protein [Novosphingobium aerophilum]MBC2661708.1 hypothetical protein [Novosphingobium aerophilum]
MTLSAPPATLARIVTVARAGSLTHALALFRAAGFDRADHDPAALAVAGRLAKDQALRAPAAERPALLARAAAAYAAADALAPQPYTRINQATLTWLAGDRAAGEDLARAVLAWLDTGNHPPETPYWLAATRAEALLLLGDRAAAGQWLGQAIARQPDAWEDQAATLRQLGLILVAQGTDAGWLDAYRPGRVIHFGGHLGIADTAAAALGTRVEAVLAEQRVIAGHGALAAGADLVVAAALLARGAELHVVLPTAPESFVAQSVAPYGGFWVELYRRVADAATSLQGVTTLGGDYQPLANRLAADVAMGAARLHAHRLETAAVQVLVTDSAGPGYGQGTATAYLGERWCETAGAGGAGQTCLAEPRSAPVAASGTKPAEGRRDLRLMTWLYLAPIPATGPSDAAFAARVDDALTPLLHRLDAGPRPDVMLSAADGVIAGFAEVEPAWDYAALALAGADPQVCVAGHYGLVHAIAAGGATTFAGAALARLEPLRRAALPGVLLASDTLAASLCVRHSHDLLVEEIGEDDGGALYAIRRRPDQ